MAMVRASKNIVSNVRELKPRKDTSRIEVRIVRLWRNYNKESGNTIEMVFVDKEGTRIHASVGEQLIKKFDDKLCEGDAIVVQLFKVYDAIDEYRTTPHPYKIGFFQTTFVGKADDFPSAVPKKYFADFSDILGGNLDHSCLVDVVGQIVNFGSLENKIIKGKDNMRLLIELRDPNLPDDSLALTNNDSSQWSVGTATSIRARFFVLNERLAIREIIDSTLVGTFVTLGTIETIPVRKRGQIGRLRATEALGGGGPWRFRHSRFKLIAHVKDDSGETNFLLFDANAQQIVRHSTAELYDEKEDEDFLPKAVSDLFGKRSSQYVVRLATDDREMVEEFADLPPKPVLMLESADDISSGSGGFTATPLSKRKSEQDEDSCLKDQHSVNKKLSQKKFKGE
ncbi:uncharacterized protein LOC111209579 [Brassica napus]|uniref:uncharacterized protein LOC111209579 n=1 Tax=Brassica napus TaxID=3708 RepID=UPI00207A8AD3|nr:uncharacterized protein LOC111209579 [Brassica napus]